MPEGVIRNIGILDLREVSSKEVRRMGRLEDVGAVLLSEENVGAFAGLPKAQVGPMVVVQEGERVFTGQIDFDDSFFEALDRRIRIVVVGQIFVEDLTPDLFKEKVDVLRLFGHLLFCSRGSLGAIQSRMEQITGQTVPVSRGARRWIGETMLVSETLDRLEDAVDLVSIGRLVVCEGVDPVKLDTKIRSLVNIGEVIGSGECLGVLQAKCPITIGAFRRSRLCSS